MKILSYLVTTLRSLLFFLSCFDHKSIGLSYLVFGTFCGFVGTYLSGVIRIELLVPGNYLFSGSETSYNVTVTSHGIIMIFYAAMPIFISGLGNYLIPLMIGCRDMAMPRLNNFALFLLVLSFFFFLISSGVFGFIPTGVSSGWTLYPPLSLTSGNSSLDFLIVSLHLNGISSLLNAVNTIVTVQFCSSVSLWHLSLFVWSLLITSYLIILVVPVLVACITALLTDDVLGTCFFSVLGGGDPVLFQHLFWFFGHPEVYIVILPAFGLVSEILGEYCSYRLIGYKVMVWSMLSIAFLGCLVWGHHMYTVGMEVDTKCYFTLATSLIAIPTGLKVLLWVASFLNSDVKFNVPITFSIFFIITFVFGGLTGIWLAQAGLDLLLHDTYFVVAHFHYVMAVSLVYMFFAAVYNWYHFITGLYYNETCARIHLVSFVLGSNLLFMPMHFLGLSGMPRRIFDYPSCFWFWNQCSTFGFFLVYISLFWFMLSLSPLLSFFFFNAPRRLLSRYGFLKFFKAD